MKTILNAADQRRLITRSEINRLRTAVVDAAGIWAAFNEADSIEDQSTDEALAREAQSAADTLRWASNSYQMAMARYYRERNL